jgi:hypothetical protein
MDIAILIANVLTLLAFALHTFVGDKELKVNGRQKGMMKISKEEKNGRWQDVVGIGFPLICFLQQLDLD